MRLLYFLSETPMQSQCVSDSTVQRNHFATVQRNHFADSSAVKSLTLIHLYMWKEIDPLQYFYNWVVTDPFTCEKKWMLCSTSFCLHVKRNGCSAVFLFAVESIHVTLPYWALRHWLVVTLNECVSPSRRASLCQFWPQFRAMARHPWQPQRARRRRRPHCWPAPALHRRWSGCRLASCTAPWEDQRASRVETPALQCYFSHSSCFALG